MPVNSMNGRGNSESILEIKLIISLVIAYLHPYYGVDGGRKLWEFVINPFANEKFKEFNSKLKVEFERMGMEHIDISHML